MLFSLYEDRTDMSYSVCEMLYKSLLLQLQIRFSIQDYVFTSLRKCLDQIGSYHRLLLLLELLTGTPASPWSGTLGWCST